MCVQYFKYRMNQFVLICVHNYYEKLRLLDHFKRSLMWRFLSLESTYFLTFLTQFQLIFLTVVLKVPTI